MTLPTAASNFVVAGGAALLGAGRTQGKPTNAAEAATQFEGLLIAEMLRSAHEASPGGLEADDESSQNSTLFDLAAEQFAQMMAKQGGLGIARVIAAGLARQNQASAEHMKTGPSQTGPAKAGPGHAGTKGGSSSL